MYTSLPQDACGEPVTQFGVMAQCKTYGTYFLATEDNNTLGCRVYVKVLNCNTCNAAYNIADATYSLNSTLATCTLTVNECVPNEAFVANCSTDADCVTKLGGSTYKQYLPAYDTGETNVAYIVYKAKCNTAKKCGWVLSAVNSWVANSTNGYLQLTSGATCANGHWGATVLISEAGELYVKGCYPCPDIDATYTGYWAYADYLKGEGTLLTGCYIDGVKQNGTVLTTFQDATGNFDIGGDCYYNQ